MPFPIWPFLGAAGAVLYSLASNPKWKSERRIFLANAMWHLEKLDHEKDVVQIDDLTKDIASLMTSIEHGWSPADPSLFRVSAFVFSANAKAAGSGVFVVGDYLSQGAKSGVDKLGQALEQLRRYMSFGDKDPPDQPKT